MSARTRLVAAAAFLVLVTVSCSSSTPEGQEDARGSTSTTADPRAPTTPPTSTAADTVSPPPTFEALSDAFRYGDDPDLDRLWDACAAGSGKACDDLYLAAPLDSEYEEFGYTCGDRPNVIICTEIDDPPAVP